MTLHAYRRFKVADGFNTVTIPQRTLRTMYDALILGLHEGVIRIKRISKTVTEWTVHDFDKSRDAVIIVKEHRKTWTVTHKGCRRSGQRAEYVCPHELLVLHALDLFYISEKRLGNPMGSPGWYYKRQDWVDELTGDAEPADTGDDADTAEDTLVEEVQVVDRSRRHRPLYATMPRQRLKPRVVAQRIAGMLRIDPGGDVHPALVFVDDVTDPEAIRSAVEKANQTRTPGVPVESDTITGIVAARAFVELFGAGYKQVSLIEALEHLHNGWGEDSVRRTQFNEARRRVKFIEYLVANGYPGAHNISPPGEMGVYVPE